MAPSSRFEGFLMFLEYLANPCFLSSFLGWLELLLTSSSGPHVSSITTKTGTTKGAPSYARKVLEICDKDGNCCQTTPDGRGLDNPGNDRESGQTDTYTDTALLGNCANEVINTSLWSSEVYISN